MRNAADHIINFGPGPAAMPQEVLQQAAEAVINYDDTGLSILEIPHRGFHFNNILEESKVLVKELCRLSDDYQVLWLHGGGRLQFCMVPMNFLGEGQTAGYIDSGFWSSEAMEYARHYGRVNVLASSKASGYTHLPPWPGEIPKDLAYVHLTTNNTIYGTQWRDIPGTDVPLIADMSSDIFSTQRDYSRFAMFYAVAQKNIGPAGVTVVVIRKDMLKRMGRTLPPMLSYSAHAAKGSVLNTPPVFAIYTSLLQLRWTKQKSIAAIEYDNTIKASLLYDEINRNSLFHTAVKANDRSMMNVCFTAHAKEHELLFINYCAARGIVGVDGHRTVGAFRVSLYNPITIRQVSKLVEAMQQFEKEYS